VRNKLNIPFNPANPGIKYEHSMGMGNIVIPPNIFRTTSQENNKKWKFIYTPTIKGTKIELRL